MTFEEHSAEVYKDVEAIFKKHGTSNWTFASIVAKAVQVALVSRIYSPFDVAGRLENMAEGIRKKVQ